MHHGDRSLPAARTLLGTGVEQMIGVAVEASGGRLAALRRAQVLHRPGRSLTVRFDAQVDGSDGRRRHETIVAMADVDGPPAGTLVLEADDERVGLFRYPHDPALPGLVAATSPAAVADLIGATVPADGLTVVAYRPGRRAVVNVRLATGEERYLKVIPPGQVEGFVSRLDRLAGAVPAPRVLSVHRGDGVVELEALVGSTLRQALQAAGTAPARAMAALPRPEEVIAVLDGLGAVPSADVPHQHSVLAAAHGHARLLATVLPVAEPRIERLLARLGDDVPQPLVTAHGDFHPAQLLVQGSAITGVLDLDDLGPGARVDDLARFLGHLVAFGVEGHQPAARRYAELVLPFFEDQVDPAELRRRTAGVLIGLATGPYRVQQADWQAACRRRIHLADRWAAGDVKSLSDGS